MKKERLDALLTARGLFESRARAQAAIMAGQVLVNEQKIDKPGGHRFPKRQRYACWAKNLNM